MISWAQEPIPSFWRPRIC